MTLGRSLILAPLALLIAAAPVGADAPQELRVVYGASAEATPPTTLGPEPQMLRGGTGEPQLRPLDMNSAWGETWGVSWIAASQFNLKLHPSSPDLIYSGHQFYTGAGRYFAQLEAIPGTLIHLVQCIYNDTSSQEGAVFQWQRLVTNMDSDTTEFEILASASSDDVGINWAFLDAGDPVTMRVFKPSPNPPEIINHVLAVGLSPPVSFAGCHVFWRRQVAPAPATATFDDVPATHRFFRYIEALADSGVTGGCDSNSYCPDAPLTRGQMAVFLAKALGMMGFGF